MADVNILIAFYSRTGVTEALAEAIAEGAERQGAEVRLRRARELSSVSNNRATPPSADDLEVARFQGRRVTDVGKALKHSGVK
jgi:multimeric flavodoxin WrbA